MLIPPTRVIPLLLLAMLSCSDKTVPSVESDIKVTSKKNGSEAVPSQVAKEVGKSLDGFWVVPVAKERDEAWHINGVNVDVFDKQGRQERLAISITSPCSLELTRKDSGGESTLRFTFKKEQDSLWLGGHVSAQVENRTYVCSSREIFSLSKERCTKWSNGMPQDIKCVLKDNVFLVDGQAYSTFLPGLQRTRNARMAKRKATFDEAKESL